MFSGWNNFLITTRAAAGTLVGLLSSLSRLAQACRPREKWTSHLYR